MERFPSSHTLATASISFPFRKSCVIDSRAPWSFTSKLKRIYNLIKNKLYTNSLFRLGKLKERPTIKSEKKLTYNLAMDRKKKQ